MTTIVRMTDDVFKSLRRHHFDPAVPRERVSYVMGTSFKTSTGTTILLAAPPVLLADDCYCVQASGAVVVHPNVLNAIFAKFAASDHDVICNVHDHWFSRRGTVFSAIDTADDRELDRYIRERFERMLKAHPAIGRPRTVLNLSVVLDQRGLDARLLDGGVDFVPIDRVDVVGERLTRIVPNSQTRSRRSSDRATDRHRDFISPRHQRQIQETVFAVVGCGGLGSVAAEGLLRIGARRLVLIDDDTLERTNLNRWQGGRRVDVGRNKAVLLEERLQDMEPAVEVETVPQSLFSAEAASALARADILIGGVDNDLARVFLNRCAVQYLVPFFDAGVNVVARRRKVDFEHRYFAVIPATTACLSCTRFDLYDRTQVAEVLADEVTAEERRRAGYVEDRPDVAAPSAYPLNLHAVSELLTEVMNFVCGFRPLATCSLGRWSGSYQRADRSNFPEGPDPSCAICGPLLGCGDGAEMPRPAPNDGRIARMMAEARERLLAETSRSSSQPEHGGSNGKAA